MQDAFADHAVGLTAPASRAEVVTPSDTVDLGYATRALYIGQTGNVRVLTASGDTVVFANLQGGVVYPFRVNRVFATGTTAADIIGLS